MNSSISETPVSIAPDTLDQPAKFKFSPIITTAIISLIVPVLYVIGRSCINDYLRTYGVASDFFEYSTQDYLYFALAGIFQTATATFKYLTTQWIPYAQIIVFVLGVVFGLHFVLKFEWEPNESWLKNKPISRKAIGSLIIGIVLSILIYWLLAVLILTLGSLIRIGQVSGRDIALNEIKSDIGLCSSKTRKDLSACMQVSKNDKVITVGRVIASSTNYIAVAKDGKATILPKDGLSFEVK